MKALTAFVAAGALAIAPAGAADPPGFPDQAEPHVGQGCLAVNTNPDRAFNPATGQIHMAPRAIENVLVLLVDACS